LEGLPNGAGFGEPGVGEAGEFVVVIVNPVRGKAEIVA
jgi:hypothetical protein